MGEFEHNLVKVAFHHMVLNGSRYEANAQRISKQDVKGLFATEHPAGLCSHFYDEYFGTLWSMIFDVARNSVGVCFSAPTHNEYRSFGLNNPAGVTEYPAIVPIKQGLQ